MKKLELSFIHLVGMKDGMVTSENNLAAPQKFKHRIIIWPSTSTPRYIPKRISNKYSNKYLYTNVYSSNYS